MPKLRSIGRYFGLSALFAAGLFAFASLGLLETNIWVAGSARGKWFDDANQLPARDYAIVPGICFRNGQPVVGLKQRLEMALALFRSGRVNAILVSGDEYRAGHEATGMRDWLLAHGVPAERIVVDLLGTRTLVTMARAAHVYGVRSAIICTQRLHATRSVFLAEGAGIAAVAYVPQARPAPISRGHEHERWKTTLAFVERYALGQTRTGSPSKGLAVLAQLVIRAVI